MRIEVPVSPSIFYPTYYSTKRRIVHQGGQFSGKTVNILCVLATRAANEKDKVITVTSESMPHLRSGALRDFERYVYPFFSHLIKQYNKSDHIFYFHSGSLIEFKSYEDEYTARGAKRDYLFINEANTFNYLTFFQLDSRTNQQTILDYNPTSRFWCHDQVIGQPETDLFISDHRHNPFLTQEKHAEIEGIKDPELWKVYARGKTGNIIGTIFPNWTRIPDEDFKIPDSGLFWGLDIGYENDPTALVRCYKIANNIFVDEVGYQSGSIPPKYIIELLKANQWQPEEPVYCENDPDYITQLAMLNIYAYNARKGPGSILAGIQKLKEYNIFYTARSKNLDEELKRYIWMTDPKNGQPINKPKPGWDHGIDATRYAVYTHFYRDET